METVCVFCGSALILTHSPEVEDIEGTAGPVRQWRQCLVSSGNRSNVWKCLGSGHIELVGAFGFVA